MKEGDDTHYSGSISLEEHSTHYSDSSPHTDKRSTLKRKKRSSSRKGKDILTAREEHVEAVALGAELLQQFATGRSDWLHNALQRNSSESQPPY